jgi:hypothetical protein
MSWRLGNLTKGGLEGHLSCRGWSKDLSVGQEKEGLFENGVCHPNGI